MPVKKIYKERCIGCGTCVQSCMNDVLKMKKGKSEIVHPEECMTCLLCEMDCPRSAILIMPP
jgi:NAD-dependent dihydropyrimidine dehydrogenase PreA subunit